MASVVAMRYAVGDEYAGIWGSTFTGPCWPTPSRSTPPRRWRWPAGEIADSLNQNRYNPLDPATPVIYGAEQPPFTLPAGRNPALDGRDPRLHQITELTLAAPSPTLSGGPGSWHALGAGFIGAGGGPEVTAAGADYRPWGHGKNRPGRRNAGAMGGPL